MVRMTHKFGLVLAGGGARGMAHAGVLRALNHLGYYPSAIAGYSMGSVVGATYSLNDNWYHDLVAMDVSGFPVVPRFDGPGIVSRLRNLYLTGQELRDIYYGWGAGEDTVAWGRSVLTQLTGDRNLEDGRVPTYVAATDILTGNMVIKTRGNSVDAVYASSALAGILPPFDDGTHLLVDGGYVDISPVDALREAGIDRVISVDPSQDRSSPNPRNGLDVLLRSIELTQDALSSLRHEKADLVLKPHFGRPIGMLEFRHKRACIAAGINAVRQAQPALVDMLGHSKTTRSRQHRRWFI
jgi:NTE family protein